MTTLPANAPPAAPVAPRREIVQACHCSLRTRRGGDGCAVCNPELDSYDNHTDRAGEAAKLERNLGNGPLAKSEAEKGNPERVLVRVTSVRKRLIDEDNLAEKYHVDCCRYAGLIHGDEPSKTKIEVCQRKAEKGEAEHTIIEITTP